MQNIDCYKAAVSGDMRLPITEPNCGRFAFTICDRYCILLTLGKYVETIAEYGTNPALTSSVTNRLAVSSNHN